SVAAEPHPVLAAVSRLPDAAAGAAAVEAAAAAPPLVARRVHDVAVRGVEHDIREARIVVDEHDLVPGFAAIRRLIDAAVGTRPEQVAGRRDVHDFRITRIDDDPGYS